jgi:AraC-like DNA-binding protein
MNKNKEWFGFWRTSKQPSVRLAFGARSAGRANILPGWQHGSGTIQWVNIYWGIKGNVKLLADNKVCTISANHFLMHPPNTIITGCVNENEGEYRWMTVDGPLALQILKEFNLPFFKPVFAGACPVQMFNLIEEKIQTMRPSAEYEAGTIAYNIISLASSGENKNTTPDKMDYRIKSTMEFMEENYTDPNLTINHLAAEIKMNRSSFSRLFRKETGFAPKIYLQRLRLQKAYRLLGERHLNISEIAYKCGFTDPAYFSRIINRHMGKSPKDFRNFS